LVLERSSAWLTLILVLGIWAAPFPATRKVLSSWFWKTSACNLHTHAMKHSTKFW
jgi:hypothetical protein